MFLVASMFYFLQRHDMKAVLNPFLNPCRIKDLRLLELTNATQSHCFQMRCITTLSFTMENIIGLRKRDGAAQYCNMQMQSRVTAKKEIT